MPKSECSKTTTKGYGFLTQKPKGSGLDLQCPTQTSMHPSAKSQSPYCCYCNQWNPLTASYCQLLTPFLPLIVINSTSVLLHRLSVSQKRNFNQSRTNLFLYQFCWWCMNPWCSYEAMMFWTHGVLMHSWCSDEPMMFWWCSDEPMMFWWCSDALYSPSPAIPVCFYSIHPIKTEPFRSPLQFIHWIKSPTGGVPSPAQGPGLQAPSGVCWVPQIGAQWCTSLNVDALLKGTKAEVIALIWC